MGFSRLSCTSLWVWTHEKGDVMQFKSVKEGSLHEMTRIGKYTDAYTLVAQDWTGSGEE